MQKKILLIKPTLRFDAIYHKKINAIISPDSYWCFCPTCSYVKRWLKSTHIYY